jgi:hypothetical protein
VANIVEPVVYTGADKAWHYRAPATYHRQEYFLVKMVVEIVDTLVHPFPGIIDTRHIHRIIRAYSLQGKGGFSEIL